MSTIIYWIGVILTIWCVWDLFAHKTVSILWKIVIAVILLSCSWIGLLIYYFFLRDKIK